MARRHESDYPIDESEEWLYIVPAAFWVPYDGNADEHSPNYEFSFYPSAEDEGSRDTTTMTLVRDAETSRPPTTAIAA